MSIYKCELDTSILTEEFFKDWPGCRKVIIHLEFEVDDSEDSIHSRPHGLYNSCVKWVKKFLLNKHVRNMIAGQCLRIS